MEWQKATAEQLEAWQIRGGYTGAGRTWQAVSTLLQLDPKRVFMPGLCGEVGSAIYWKNSDLSSEGISTEEIVARLGVPDHPVINEAADRWMNNLPLANPLDILDFLYIEQRLGCWAGPNHYGHINNVRIVPLSDREIFTLMLELPAEYRFRQLLAIDLVQQFSRELSRIPFNEDIGIRVIVRRARRKCRALVKSMPGFKKAVSTFKIFFR